MSDGPPLPALDDPPLPSSPSDSIRSAPHDHFPFDSHHDDPSASQSTSRPPDETPESRIAAKCHSKLLELLNTYDSLVYLELAALYYLDTSTVLIVLRTLIHLTQISHARTLALARASRLNFKPVRTNIFLVLSINIVAFLVHALVAPSEGSEATRGYLHGHLIVDLIGQTAVRGWLGRLRLCLMDCLVATLQVVAVGIVGELDRAEGLADHHRVRRRARSPGRQRTGAVEDAVRETRAVRQGRSSIFDLLRGQREGGTGTGGTDVELQTLAPALRRGSREQGPSGDVDEAQSEQQPLQSSSGDALRDEHGSDGSESASLILDSFSSGQVVLTRLRLADLVRNHFWEWRNQRLIGRV